MPRPARLFLIFAAMMLFVVLLILRAAQVQLFQADRWAEVAANQQRDTEQIPAPRGGVYDMEGIPLAGNIEYVSIGVSPRELTDRKAVAAQLVRLKVPRSVIRLVNDADRVWVNVPGHFTHDDVRELRGVKGVYLDAVYERRYSNRPSTRRLVGRATAAAGGTDGLERALDEYLTGTSGERTSVRDGARRRRGSPDFSSVPPRPGDDVVLTISQEWQEIAERALRDAVDSSGAEGGDMVVLDPYTGAVRALAAVRRNRPVSGIPALTEPFEPGSTIKPLIAASLLMLGRASPSDTVNVGNGRYTTNGRTINDDHRGDSLLSLVDVIAHSSNVGIVKFVERLTRPEEYQALRDFGLGTPTGIAYPSEAPGRLPLVRGWSDMSPASLAIGYELSVTALQLGLAYASFANGGELLAPALVQEIRTRDGTVKYRHEKRVVRRVMTPGVAETVLGMLRETVEAGTATAAAPAGFQVAGKTGTARKVIDGAYRGYTASFVGMFPADNPQVVVVVKLDNPAGSRIYGGQIAAPAFKAAIEAAMAARGASMDRARLASSGRFAETAMVAMGVAEEPPVIAVSDQIPPHADSVFDQTARFDLPLALPPDTSSTAPRAVPDVVGLSLRDAALVLHEAGFRVRVSGSGKVVKSAPSAGTSLAAGGLVRVSAEP
ncbi:MAG TPA: penicillin-binding protein [Gemmatimonadaceae bacterium]